LTFQNNYPDDLPDKPGVYIMKDIEDRVIYVGKAKNLKKRVKSYFKDDLESPKTRAQMRQFHHLEYMVTDTEKEALILESNLIKKHMPRYNVRLKDGKRYPYIKISNEDYPRVFITRRVADDGSYYYGPFTDSGALKQMVKYLKSLFKIRDCKRMDGPCLNSQIDICNAPCDGRISKKEYRENIDKVTMFFEGKYTEIVHKLKEEMAEAARNHEYEKAAVLRDQLNSIDTMLERQKMEMTGDLDQDVVALSSDENITCVVVFSIREGKIIGKDDFLMNGAEDTPQSKVLSAFLKQYYSGPRHVPKEIIIQDEVDDARLIMEWLSEKRENKVTLKVPKKGRNHRMVQMVAKNADIIRQHHGRVEGALVELKNYLKIPQLPRRIEGFDISNISGKMPVGSMVVFEDGKPKKSAYRKYKVETKGPDDYNMMREVLTRRYQKLVDPQENGGDVPDLILVDGGKGQLNVALEVLNSLKLNLPVIGLAKEFEEIFMPDLPSPIILPRDSESLKLLQRVRDEAHRFAVTYHKKLRSKEQDHSLLDDIPGVGVKRKMKLLRHFGSLDNLLKAGASEIAEVEGINKKLANTIHDYLEKTV
jgi:excinuclease ABC subunit C